MWEYIEIIMDSSHESEVSLVFCRWTLQSFIFKKQIYIYIDIITIIIIIKYMIIRHFLTNPIYSHIK